MIDKLCFFHVKNTEQNQKNKEKIQYQEQNIAYSFILLLLIK